MAEVNLKNISKKFGRFIELTGLKTFIRFKLDDTLAITRGSASQDYCIGQKVELHSDMKKTLLFDKELEIAYF